MSTRPRPWRRARMFGNSQLCGRSSFGSGGSRRISGHSLQLFFSLFGGLRPPNPSAAAERSFGRLGIEERSPKLDQRVAALYDVRDDDKFLGGMKAGASRPEEDGRNPG